MICRNAVLMPCECVYLVAVLNSYPVGQVQVDLAKHAATGTGLVWALRVLPALQGLGVGTRLMRAAEDVIRASGLPVAELGVAKDNPRAQRLYERLGYVVVADAIDHWSFTTPEGETREVEESEWIMRKQLGSEHRGSGSV